MHAITVKQPWAEAIARHGKTVENRTRRPPAHLIGQRIAIHVGKTWSDMPTSMPIELTRWTADMLVNGNPPRAGFIVATARLSGVLVDVGNGVVCSWVDGSETVEDIMASSAARRGPWFTGPVGWVLADVRPLAVPVGADPCVVCDAQFADPTGRYGHASNCRGYGEKAIRGQVYPFALSPEVEAAILRQEAPHAG